MARGCASSHLSKCGGKIFLSWASGTAHHVWSDYREGDWDIYYARFDSDGRRKSVAKALTTASDDADGDYQYGPVVAVEPDDAIYVVYADRYDCDWYCLQYTIEGKKSTDGGDTWTQVLFPGQVFYSLDFGPGGPQELVDGADPIDLYVDGSNVIHLVWTEFNDNQGITHTESMWYSHSLDGGSTWSSQQTLYSESYPDPGYDHYNKVRYPKVAKGQDDGGNEHVHALYSWDSATEPLGGP
jgi:hypothetical protein